MKKTIFCLALGVFATHVFAAESCENASQYKVNNITFTKINLADAVRRLTAGMPFITSISGASPSLLVTGADISGPLDEVLNDLSGEAGFMWEQRGCRLDIKVPVVKIDAPFALKKGQRIDEEVRQWLQKQQWALTWEAPDLVSSVDVPEVSGELDAILEMVITALNRSGNNLHVEMYEDVRMIRIWGGK